MPIDSFYTSGYTIKRPTQSIDSGGAVVLTFADLVSTYGRLRPLTGTEILGNEKLGLVTSHRFYCAVMDIDVKDRIYDSVNGKTYEIKFVKDPMQMGVHLEIDCELIESAVVEDNENLITSDLHYVYDSENEPILVQET